MVIRSLALLLCACGAPRAAEPASVADPIGEMETALLSAPFHAHVVVYSTGNYTHRLEGELTLDRPRASLHLAGTFDDDPASPWVELDGERMRGGPNEGETAFDTEAPREAFDAVAIGFARMGLLHNAFRLYEGEPPDHADGGVREWLTAGDVTREDDEIAFTLIVDGEPSAEARVTTRDRLPTARAMIVHFGEGEMRVNETYDL